LDWFIFKARQAKIGVLKKLFTFIFYSCLKMELQQLNLPAIELKSRTVNERTEVFDPIRKVYVSLTPEEWVRQHFIHYLLTDRQVPAGLIAVEKQIKVNRLSKRCDIVVYNPNGQPLMVVECKAPKIRINQETYNQAIRYNLSLNIRYVVLTNGLNHFCFELDYDQQSHVQMDHIPSFREIIS
jgi:type I site-specific restriction-modification system R (restriction) subunit